jgi:hypothetical protein
LKIEISQQPLERSYYNLKLKLKGQKFRRGTGKITSNGRQPRMEDNLKWNTPSNGRPPQMEVDLKWNTTSSGRRPEWKTTSNGRLPQIEDDPKILKREYIWNHLLDHTQNLNLSLDVQIIFYISLK